MLQTRVNPTQVIGVMAAIIDAGDDAKGGNMSERDVVNRAIQILGVAQKTTDEVAAHKAQRAATAEPQTRRQRVRKAARRFGRVVWYGMVLYGLLHLSGRAIGHGIIAGLT